MLQHTVIFTHIDAYIHIYIYMQGEEGEREGETALYREPEGCDLGSRGRSGACRAGCTAGGTRQAALRRFAVWNYIVRQNSG